MGTTKPKPGESLAEVNPTLASQWHPTKNEGLTPKNVKPGCGFKVWWLCPICHNEWQATINSRNRGNGCSKCGRENTVRARTTPKPGESFGDLYPELISEWHPTKNKELNPFNVKPRSNKKVWWICSTCGKEWQAQIDDRSNNNGCPGCRGEKISKARSTPNPGESLAEVDPKLASQWHPTANGSLTPFDVKSGSGRKVWWLCSDCGHEWRAVIGNRLGGNGCPRCTSVFKTSFGEKAVYYYVRKLLGKDNVVPNYHPEGWGGLELDVFVPSLNIAVEFDGPAHGDSDVTDREYRKEILCKRNGIELIRIRYPGLPEVLGGTTYQLTDNTNDSIAVAIEQLVEYIRTRTGLDSDIDVDLERDNVGILEIQHSGWLEKSLVVTNPELASEWHPTRNGLLRPDNFSYGSGHKVWWLCPICGHEWQAVISSRSHGYGCPRCGVEKCSQSRSIPKSGKSLADIHPELVAEWHPIKNECLTPWDVKPGTHRKVWWLCPICGHEWQAQICNRAYSRGCPECAKTIRGKARSAPKPGESFADLHPELVNEWHPTKNEGLTPWDVYPKAPRKVWWLCPVCQNEWQAIVSSRSNGRGCPKCSGRKRGEMRRKNKSSNNQSLDRFLSH